MQEQRECKVEIIIGMMISIGRILRGTAFVAFAVAALLPTLPLSARDMELPTTRVNGREMYYYDTQRGENIYGVAEKLGITRDELVKYNPAAADGLRPRRFDGGPPGQRPGPGRPDPGGGGPDRRAGEAASPDGRTAKGLSGGEPEKSGGLRPAV